MVDFLQGCIFIAHIVIILHFIKFWLRTRDRLFLLFGLMFGLLALHRILRFAIPVFSDNDWPIYTLRFVAYMFPILGIIGKTFPKRKKS
jgi:hypothetical protein